MSNISEITANNSSAAYEVTKDSAKTAATKTSGTHNYGKTFGKPQLSDEAAKYYDELKSKYSGMDFVLVSKDMKETAKASASSFGNANRMVVLIDEEKIERMATDPEYRAKYEGLIAQASAQMPKLMSAMAGNSNIKTIGMQVNDNGTASFFAVMSKSSQEMTEKLQEKRAAKKAAEKEAEKKAAKKEQAEKLQEKIAEKAGKSGEAKAEDDEEDYEILMASSVEELLKKIDNYTFSMRANSVQTPYEKTIGQTIDFKG